MKKIIRLFQLYIIILATTLVAIAQGDEQTTSDTFINVNFRQEKLERVFEVIESNTSYKFIYQKNILDGADGAYQLTLKQQKISLAEILEIISANTSLMFKPSGKNIIISQNPNSSSDKKIIKLQGVIRDENNEPIPGASVLIKGTTKGVVTDVDGRFAIHVQKGQRIICQHISCETHEATVTSNRLDVMLKMKSTELDELVYIAYDQVKRKDITGAVSEVNVKELKNRGFNTVDQMLQGNVSGVYAVSADGSPGGRMNLRIRGITSIVGANEPLYVIDGIPFQPIDPTITGSGEGHKSGLLYGEQFSGTTKNDRLNTIDGSYNRGFNPLSMINVNNIESISVLKDAAATSLYGSRGSNGVILINTKKGRAGKPTINISYRTSLENAFKPDLLNKEEYIKVMTIAAANGNTQHRTVKMINHPDSAYFGNSDTDWVKEITQLGVTHSANASISGGSSDGGTYALSVVSTHQKGTIKTTGMTNNSINLQLSPHIHNKLSLTGQLGYAQSLNNLSIGAYHAALTARPDMSIKDSLGNYTKIGLEFDKKGQRIEEYRRQNQNPVAALEQTFDINYRNITGSLSTLYKFSENVSWDITLSTIQSTSNSRLYTPDFMILNEHRIKGERVENTNEREYYNWRSTVRLYKPIVQDHSLRAVLGASLELEKNNDKKVKAEGFPDNKVLNNFGSATNRKRFSVKGADTFSRLQSFFTKFSYQYRDKYMIDINARVDGSSRFSAKNRYGFFPSVGLAWDMVQEPFLQNSRLISFLKLRVSMGVTGSNQLDNFAWRTLYTAGQRHGGMPSIIPSQLGNELLKWEKTKDVNVGLDFGLFSSRFTGNVNAYYRHTEDALIPIQLPESSGYPQAFANLATSENRGIEILLKGDIIQGENFSWSLSYNFSYNKNKIIAISGFKFSDPHARKIVQNFSSATIVSEGESVGTFYGFVVDGIYKSQKEIDELNAKAPKNQYQRFAQVGRFRYKDLNNDGVIDSKDRKALGKAFPDFYGGVSSNITYKNWSFNIQGNFSIGNSLYWQTNENNLKIGNSNNRFRSILRDPWSFDNANSKQPKIIFHNRQSVTHTSDYFVHDASYFRVKSITLTYNFPASLFQNSFVERISVYATGTNLLTFTKYPGMDPETNAISNATFSGIDFSTYPRAKVYTLGVNLTF